ncbi:MAG TPA: chemotaxis protein CheB [Thermoleophilia bacterium]|nr:chemotaxis protein CheB [Thermoleophilia bacterium]
MRPTSAETDAATLPTFPVVGVGASAGGLEAVSLLLEHVPAGCGLAIVVVQHLMPDHESILADLLGRKSSLPVSEVTDGVVVAPDHAYVIPPGFDLRLERDRLRLSTRDQGQRPSMPIDGFFRSLADTLHRRAIGVVLSGAASDGALGLSAIKAEGGITFAQDPLSAKYDGMPRAAMAANVVDHVLAPREIAIELERIARHPDVAPPGVEPPPPAGLAAAKDLNPQIFTALRRAFGLDFTYYKFSTVGRRIARRMVLRHLDSLDEYVKLLHDEPAELEALYQDLLVMVTEFFREPETFAALRSKVFPALVEGREPERELRLWVPGCASGEEAYSLAMALDDFLEGRPVRPRVRVFATDVNPRAIDRARPGIYGENIAASMPPGYLARYFIRVAKGYQVAKAIRERCIFATHDLTGDPPFSHLDLVSCRNLLIYLGPTLQRRVITTLHYALDPGGYLALGTAETVSGHGELFEVVDKKQRIYRARPRPRGLPRELMAPAAGAPATATETGAGPLARSEPFDLETAVDDLVRSSYSPPGVVVNDRLEIVQFRGNTEPFLLHVSGKATLGLLAMAHDDLAVHLGAAVADARRTGRPVARPDLQMRMGERTERLHVHVVPVSSPDGERFFVVLFEAAPDLPAGRARRGGAAASRTRAESVERELAATRDYLQTVIEDKEATNEELRAANEEVQSSNEELQSINEELETAKEELQSTNEELVTVNDELSGRNAELAAVSDDLSNLFASIDIPLLMVGRDLRVRRLTPAASGVFGLGADALDRPLAGLDLPVVVADLSGDVRKVIDTAVPFAADVRDRRGRWYSMRIRPYTTAERAVGGAVIAFVDVDEIKRNAEQIRETAHLNAALAAIHLEISSTLDTEEILGRAVVEGAAALEAEAASIALREEGAWVTRYAHGYDPVPAGRFTDADLPHVALAAGTRAPVAINHAGEDERISLTAVRLLRLRSVLAVPLVSKDEVTGVLLFNWHDRPVTLTPGQIDFAGKLASSVSLALDNARLYRERTDSVHLAETLNAIGATLAAARDVETIARTLAGEGSRAIGCEGAVVALREDEQFVIRVATGVGGPLLGHRFARDENPLVALGLTGEPFVSNEARGDSRLAPGFADRFDLRSLLFVPLMGRELLGVLAFGNVSSGSGFVADQVRFATALAAAGSLAIENVHAYETEHRTAESLRKLLAFPIPELPGVRIGAAHRAAASAERVGGDFFDLFALDDHTIALFIADVSGKGVRAAGFTETVRSAVRALAYIEPAPAYILEHVNESLMRQGPEGLFATAALFVLDSTTGAVSYSSAGHPPAVVCGSGCVPLPTDAGVPLGTFRAAYSQQTFRLEGGEVLLAFTDGITEARHDAELFGEARLLRQLAAMKSRDPQDLVDGILAAATSFAGGALTDDAAVIAISLAPERGSSRDR